MSALTIRDPHDLILHRAVRATIAVPAMVAVGDVVLDDLNLTLFAAFGAFALLAFADFGGAPGPRTRAYVVLIAIGVVMIALGTATSEHVVVGAILLAAITFVITLAGVFGGYFAAGGPAAILLFVVAVMVPAPVEEIPGREAGFLLAGAVSIVLATFVLPARERLEIRLAAGELATRLAQLLRRGETTDAGDAAALHDEVTKLRDRYRSSVYRPAGPARRDQALVRLLDQLQRAVSFATRLPVPVPASTRTATDRDVDDVGLVETVADTFDHSAAVLRGDVEPVEGARLAPIRDRHREALERWVAGALRGGRSHDEVGHRLAQAFAVRVLAHTALSCEGDAVLAAGGELADPDPAVVLDTPAPGGASVTLGRALALLRPHLRTGSAAFRNALRAALALSAALVVANLVHAQHGFWVVLGTLTVLKSSAMRTGMTALQALAGNLIGFAIAGLGAVALSGHPAALWIVLPVGVFLAAYAPSAIHFVIGQASFTVFVVVLFNILSPEGWRTGLVRVESVAIGAAVSIVVGIVLWPRGNRTALREATAAFYRSVAAYLGAVLDAVLHPAPHGSDPRDDGAVHGAWTDARAAELTCDVALYDLLGAPTAANVPIVAWTRLSGVARSLRLVGDGLRSISTSGDGPLLDAPHERQLEALGTQRVDAVAAVAACLEHGGGPPPPADVTVPLTTWLADVDPDDEGAIDGALAMVFTVEWIQFVDTLLALDDEPLLAVSADAANPWWR